MLGDRTPDEFLDEYWQKKPLLIRNALPDFESPLDPGELAGLALDPDVQSRIIREVPGGSGESGEKAGGSPEAAGPQWELREGPFEQDDFLNLPETHWTVLVQEVDRLVPEVGDLLEHFRFLPDWRIDDVMISYAPEGGNVGPHIDNYDVFLLQGLGHRNWQYGSEPVEDETIVDGMDVRVLADFEPDEEHVLGPGDVLYLPPRVAHHGVAMDDCMTYSIGFRAPSHQELVGDFLQYALERIDPDARYSDPDLAPADHPGEITDDALERVRSLLRSLVADEEAIDRWFGQYVTEPQRDRIAIPRETPLSAEDVATRIEAGTDLRRSPATRLAFTVHDDGSCTLFANGTPIDLGADQTALAGALAGRECISASALRPHLLQPPFDDARALVTDLVNEGLLEFDDGALGDTSFDDTA